MIECGTVVAVVVQAHLATTSRVEIEYVITQSKYEDEKYRIARGEKWCSANNDVVQEENAVADLKLDEGAPLRL